MKSNQPNTSSEVRIDAWSFDLGAAGDTIKSYAEACIQRVESSWADGADLVLFPEYTWAGLEPLLPVGAGLRGVADAVSQCLQSLVQRLSVAGKAAVLGSSPYYDTATGELRNRALIINSGELLWQDKLFLTPWETTIVPGAELRVFECQGLRVAVLICLDIEVPELSVMLRGQAIDLILVPSATEALLGCERINRCASARAVELGCTVVVSPLVGRCASELVDENLGKLAVYLPSQECFREDARQTSSELLRHGFHCLSHTICRHKLSKTRQRKAETNPAHLAKAFTSREIRLV